MYRNVLKKHWYTLFKELKERWPDLTQSDIEFINADVNRLVDVVAARRHVSRAEAQQDVDTYLRSLDPRSRPPQ